MIYTVFSTTDSPYMNWQSDLLEYSWKETGQPGQLIRLVASSERDSLPVHRHAEVVATWPWEIHPLTGDHYVIYNKPASLSQWFARENLEGTILFIDPDCVFRAPITREVSVGHPVGQTWIGFRQEGCYYPPSHGPAFELIARFSKKNRDLVQGVMIPTLIHSTDLKMILPRWLELTALIRRDVRNSGGQPLWESDMFGYVIAAAEYGLVHEEASLGICTNWLPADVPNAPIIHYCQTIQNHEHETIWSKRTYRPWDSVPDPSLAQMDYGQDLLEMINRFVAHKTQEACVMS
ncbi:MAG: hypothetical protein O7F12_03870 [Nitrospirae bacterium]|nr:hypothetical protein [Nitrospirota bacterium]